ncbi:host specificity factor TipJ family phage tail protein [Ruegeria atlantica]|uniref:host specificity factor TipJ family phage tail protein n=1 Tax=Ruegeria atlantica TaxID=81569 RepID=UPI00147D02CC|nr:host specificity factor TipJ family phage tail protein [Ruegeria atlantica]
MADETPLQGLCNAPACGRVLADLWPHPLTAEGRVPQISLPVEPGMTVMQALGQIWPERGAAPVIVSLDGVTLPEAAWALTPVAPGQRLTLRAALQGGDSDPLVAVLTIVTAIVTAGVSSGIAAGKIGGFAAGSGAATWAGAAAGAAISFTGGLIINALVPARDPDGLNAGAPVRTDYSLTGGSNRARPYEPLLLLLGRHRVFPDLGARPWTEFEGDDQWLNMMLHFGLGNPQFTVEDLRIGDQPLSSFPGAIATILRGSDPAWPANVDTVQGADLKDTRSVIRRTSAGTHRIDLDFVGRLFGINRESGDSYHAPGFVEIAWRRVGVREGWTRRRVRLQSSGSPRDAIRRTIRIDLATTAQWELRVRRAHPPSTADNRVDEISWTALRSFQPDTADYAGQTRVRLRLPASAQASGQLPAVHVIAHQPFPAGPTRRHRPRATSNPAWILLGFLRGSFINGRLAWGMGKPDSLIDLPAITAWAGWCDEQGLTCNLVIDRKMEIDDVIRTICQCGRASPTLASGKYGVIWDDPATPATALVTPGNIIQGSFEVTWSGKEPADEIAMRYLDPNTDWQYQTIRRLMPGVTTPRRTATVTLSGVTDGRQAASECNLQAARQLYHRRRMSWEMAGEGLNIARGDVVYLTHSLIDGGFTGRLAGVQESGDTYPERWDLGRAFDIPEDETWFAMLRLDDGRLHTSRITADGPLLRPATALPEDWQGEENAPEDVIWRVYPGNAPPAPVRIVAFEPVAKTNRARLEAIDEVAAYHNAASADLSTPLPLPIPQSPRVLSAQVTDRTLPDGSIGITLRLTTAGPWRGATVRAQDSHGWRVVAEITDATQICSWDTDDAPGSTIDIEITPGSRAAPTGAVFVTRHSLIGDRTVPIAAPGNFAVEFLGDGSRRFTATPPSNTRVAGYALRYGSASTAESWDALTPLMHGRVTTLPVETRLPPAGRWRFAIAALDKDGVPGTPAFFGPVDLPDAVKLPVTQYAFYATATDQAPRRPARGGDSSDTHVPRYWSRAPLSLSVPNRFQWIIERKGRTGGGPWTNWSAPALWSSLGDDGADGSGVEMIFRRTASALAPATPRDTAEARRTDDYVPAGWSDDPAGVGPSEPYEWVSERRGRPGNWGPFSAPALWAKYSRDGADGRAGADGRDGTDGQDGEPGRDGQDGTGVEMIFRRTADNAPPQVPAAPVIPFARRRFVAPHTRALYWNVWFANNTLPEITDGVIVGLVAPVDSAAHLRLIVREIDSEPLQRGAVLDANGRTLEAGHIRQGETVYVRYEATPVSGWRLIDPPDEIDHVSAGWSDDPVGVTPSEPYEWVSERRGRPGNRGPFSAPALWAKYSRDGERGPPGRDGPGSEFIFRVTSSPVRPPTPRSTAQARRIDDHVPDGWFDDAPGVNARMPYLWASKRTGSSGNWSAFSRPVLWSRYGRDGSDGQDGEPGRDGSDGEPGAPGKPGSRGPRGAGIFRATISSRGWIDTVANRATPGHNVIGDVVTLSNAAGGWAETRAWSGSAWVAVEHVIDGNTVIPGTLVANALAAGQIEARHLNANRAVITNGLQLGSGLITFAHLDNSLIADIARGGRWRVNVANSNNNYIGSWLTPSRIDGGSDIVVRRDSAGEVMRYSLTLSNLYVSPGNYSYRYLYRNRSSEDDPVYRIRYSDFRFAFTLSVAIQLDGVTFVNLSRPWSHTDRTSHVTLGQGVLPTHLTPIGVQKRLGMQYAVSANRVGTRDRYGKWDERNPRTQWNVRADLTLAAREARPFA